MTNSKRRKLMIKERMRATSEGYIAASKKIGAWWEQHRKGISPKKRGDDVNSL